MSEAIFSLIGVVLGGLVTSISTYFYEWKSRKYEKKQQEKELICNVIKQHEILSDKIYFNIYYQDDPQNIIKYISKKFIKIRRDNRNKELLFINRDLLNNIEKADNSLFSFDNPYDGKELLKDSPFHDTAFTADMIMDDVHKYNSINFFQRMLLPFPDNG